MQNLRVPYRIGYTALAALRFVPRFRHELEVIRAAHRVRGTDGGRRSRSPRCAARSGIAIPLLASAIRHAERVALAMDARAFGAHPTRTERAVSRWRARDTVFVAAVLGRIGWDLHAVLPLGARLARPTASHTHRSEPGDPALSALIALGASELPSRPFHAYIVGEQALPTGARRHLVSDRGLDKDLVSFFGYWRVGAASPTPKSQVAVSEHA